MDSFNKVLSFILGLVVVLVFIIVLSNRLHWGDKFLPFQGLGKTTPTPIAHKITPTPTPTVVFTYPGQNKGGYHPTGMPPQQTQASGSTKGGLPIQTIPSTGSPTELLALFSGLGAMGVYLRRKS